MESLFINQTSRVGTLVASLAFFVSSLAYSAPVPSPPSTSPSHVVDLNIVAHEDDDILFMNPDILNALVAGHREVTVYITSGNYRPDDYFFSRARELGAMDGYSKALQLAKAVNAGTIGNPASTTANSCISFESPLSDNPGLIQWSIQPFTFGPFTVTVAVPAGASLSQLPLQLPPVTLIFLRLDASRTPDGEPVEFDLQNQDQGSAYSNLSELWRGAAATIRTSDQTTSYTRDQLTDALQAIMTVVNPSVVRTQDSLNTNIVDGPNALQVTLTPGGPFPYDHSDHYYGALFARLALHNYVRAIPGVNPSYVVYTGYSVDQAGKPGVQTLTAQQSCLKKTIDYYYSLNDPNITFGVLQQFGGGYTGYPFSYYDYNWLQHQLPTRVPLP